MIFDYNPSESNSWLYDLPKNESVLIKSTYRDNPFLPDSIKRTIEDLKRTDADLYQIYALGEKAMSKSNIYSNWTFLPHRPSRFTEFVYGLDFGYSNDPTSIVAVYYYNGGYILDEITYQKGLSNKQIADIILNQSQVLVVADSAEPKSIDEIMIYGVNIIPVTKGKDSVNHGIQIVQAQRMSMTKRSVNIIREYRNYLWETDKNGKITNKPEPGFDHSMDALRYALSTLNIDVGLSDVEKYMLAEARRHAGNNYSR
jgi:phage terminase large subunit